LGQLQFSISHPAKDLPGRRPHDEDCSTVSTQKAFAHFLRLAELEWPSSVDDPVVGLFLFVCDTAIKSARRIALTYQA
jgi:hypothetical protein